jgi:hypothetical protein
MDERKMSIVEVGAGDVARGNTLQYGRGNKN